MDGRQIEPIVAETELVMDVTSDTIIQAVLDACPDSIFVTDSKGVILQANRHAAESLNTEIAKLTGVAIFDKVPAGATEVLRALCQSALETGAPAMKDEERDGRFYETLIKPQSSGAETLLTIYIRNITKRRQAELDLEKARVELEVRVTERTAELTREVTERKFIETSLKQSEERLRDITLAAADQFWETDTELRYTFVSHPEDDFWRAGEDLLGKQLWGVAPEWQDEDAWAEIKLLTEQRKPIRDFRFRRNLKDSDTGEGLLYLRISARPFYDENGKFQGYRGTTSNETAEMIAKLKADELWQQFAEAMENLTEGFVLWNADEELVFCNSQVVNDAPEEMRPYLVPGILRNKYLELYRQCDDITELDERHQDWFSILLEPGAASIAEFKHGDRWIMVRGQRLKNGALAVFHSDVTDQRNREEELTKAHEAAEIANRTKTEFLANMSHELRSPLTAILGYSEVMQEGTFGPIGNEKYEGYVDNIRTSGLHLQQLIDDILDVSAIEAGKLTLHDEAVSIHQILESVQLMMAIRIEEAGLEMVADLPDSLPMLRADVRRIKQILINLLSNAIKFTPEEGLITLRVRLSEDGDLKIDVSDTGIGMDDDGILVALRKFGQVDGSMTRDQEGSGLGLPLTKGLIAAHGGSMEITSAPGHGTTVTVIFPAERMIDLQEAV